jgi:ribonuclease D
VSLVEPTVTASQEAKEKMKQADLQRLAKAAWRNVKNGEVVKDFLIHMYSIYPFNTSELEELLKEHKVDETFAKEILDAIKKAEKNAPLPSEYRNWQSKDGLFKAKAKYVSFDAEKSHFGKRRRQANND